MMQNVFIGILLPFLGTVLGALCVFFMKKSTGVILRHALTAFAAGVMVAASVWSLLIPSMEATTFEEALRFIPATVGFWLGILFLSLLDRLTPHLHINSDEAEGPRSSLKRTTMLILAVVIHNIPEGMAVGVVYAGLISGNVGITPASALALSIGIAVQNFPEGAIISMPLKSEGVSRIRAFLYGAASAVPEVLGAVITVLCTGFVVPILPYLLGFAAGAMMFVVVEELIPEMTEGNHENLGTVVFTVGFTLMMSLDVALG